MPRLFLTLLVLLAIPTTPSVATSDFELQVSLKRIVALNKEVADLRDEVQGLQTALELLEKRVAWLEARQNQKD